MAMCNSLDLDLQVPSALASQKLLLMALEEQNWHSAALFALLLCEAMPEEAAAGLAIALLAARHTKTAPQQAQHLQDSPSFAEMAKPRYQMQQHGSSSTDAGEQQALSGTGVVHIVTRLHAKVQCTPTVINIVSRP